MIVLNWDLVETAAFMVEVRFDWLWMVWCELGWEGGWRGGLLENLVIRGTERGVEVFEVCVMLGVAG